MINEGSTTLICAKYLVCPVVDADEVGGFVKCLGVKMVRNSGAEDKKQPQLDRKHGVYTP